MSTDKQIGAFGHIKSKKIQYMINLMKQTENLREKATSFKPKKHQDENASGASDFLRNHFQMSTRHLEPITTITKQYMFLQEVEKKDTNSPSRKPEKKHPKIKLFFTKLRIRGFSCLINEL